MRLILRHLPTLWASEGPSRKGNFDTVGQCFLNLQIFKKIEGMCVKNEFLFLTGDTVQLYLNPVYHIVTDGRSSVLRSYSAFVN